MKHIYFTIYRLKSIITIYYCYCLFYLFVYSEIEFIKPSEDVKIQRTVTFTKDEKSHTIFINKMIKSGIMRMFIFFVIFIFIYFILLAKCYAFAQMIVIILV
jgi:hypothetical protein